MSSRFMVLKDNENIFKKARVPKKRNNNNQNNTNLFKKTKETKEKKDNPKLIITDKSTEFPELTNDNISTKANKTQISYKGLLKTNSTENNKQTIRKGMITLPLSKIDAERIIIQKRKLDMELEFERHREVNNFFKRYAAIEREERIKNGEKFYECSEFEEVIEYSDDDDSDDNSYIEDADYETPYYNTR